MGSNATTLSGGSLMNSREIALMAVLVLFACTGALVKQIAPNILS
jgi:hypothetical protein